MEPESAAQQALARRWVELIVQVQSGQLTVRQASRLLGVSRKTYYKKEKRVLAAMMQALAAQPGGRPSQEQDREKEKLQQQVQELHHELLVQEQRAAIRSQLVGMETPKKKVPASRTNREHDPATATADPLVIAQDLPQGGAAACELPKVEKPSPTRGRVGENAGT